MPNSTECGWRLTKADYKYYCLRVAGHDGMHMGISQVHLDYEEMTLDEALDQRVVSTIEPWGLATIFKESIEN